MVLQRVKSASIYPVVTFKNLNVLHSKLVKMLRQCTVTDLYMSRFRVGRFQKARANFGNFLSYLLRVCNILPNCNYKEKWTL